MGRTTWYHLRGGSARLKAIMKVPSSDCSDQGRVVSTGSAPSLGLEVGSELLDRLKPVTKIQTRKPGHECGPIRPTTSTSYNFEHAVGYGQTALPLVETRLPHRSVTLASAS